MSDDTAAPFADDFGIEIHCVYSDLRSPGELRPNPDNPNRHSAHQIQLLASIIQEQGWRSPITVSKRSGLVVRGHGRLEAALLLGLTQVPVDEQDYETEAEELADLVADNRLAELAELDPDGLKAIMEKIAAADPNFDRELTGFQEDEIRQRAPSAKNMVRSSRWIPRGRLREDNGDETPLHPTGALRSGSPSPSPRTRRRRRWPRLRRDCRLRRPHGAVRIS